MTDKLKLVEPLDGAQPIELPEKVMITNPSAKRWVDSINSIVKKMNDLMVQQESELPDAKISGNQLANIGLTAESRIAASRILGQEAIIAVNNFSKDFYQQWLEVNSHEHDIHGNCQESVLRDKMPLEQAQEQTVTLSRMAALSVISALAVSLLESKEVKNRPMPAMFLEAILDFVAEENNNLIPAVNNG